MPDDNSYGYGTLESIIDNNNNNSHEIYNEIVNLFGDNLDNTDIGKIVCFRNFEDLKKVFQIEKQKVGSFCENSRINLVIVLGDYQQQTDIKLNFEFLYTEILKYQQFVYVLNLHQKDNEHLL